jgi:hypothetical protein
LLNPKGVGNFRFQGCLAISAQSDASNLRIRARFGPCGVERQLGLVGLLGGFLLGHLGEEKFQVSGNK